MFVKLPRNRRFSYQPRYSQPGLEDRLKFKRKTLHRARGGRSVIFYLILVIIFALVYLYLRGGNVPSQPQPIPLSQQDAVIKIEIDE